MDTVDIMAHMAAFKLFMRAYISEAYICHSAIVQSIPAIKNKLKRLLIATAYVPVGVSVRADPYAQLTHMCLHLQEAFRAENTHPPNTATDTLVCEYVEFVRQMSVLCTGRLRRDAAHYMYFTHLCPGSRVSQPVTTAVLKGIIVRPGVSTMCTNVYNILDTCDDKHETIMAYLTMYANIMRDGCDGNSSTLWRQCAQYAEAVLADLAYMSSPNPMQKILQDPFP